MNKYSLDFFLTLERFDQSDERTRPDQQKDNDKNKDKKRQRQRQIQIQRQRHIENTFKGRS